MSEQIPIEILNVERDVSSGMHEPEGEAMWSVSNDVSMADDKLPGGLAYNKLPSDFNEGSLSKGVKVELEHTTDSDLAEEIAMDHLMEDPKYYEKLELIESLKVVNMKKESMGLLDLPSSIGGGDGSDESFEVINFKGTPQNPGLSREMGSGEETDFYGAKESGVDLPQRNNKYQDSDEFKENEFNENEFIDFLFGNKKGNKIMSNELKKLEGLLREMGKVNEANYIIGMNKTGQAKGSIVRPGDPYTYDPNPDGFGYVIVSGPNGIGNVIKPFDPGYTDIRSADPRDMEGPGQVSEPKPDPEALTSAGEHYQKGLNAAKQGNFTEAVTHFQASYNETPHKDSLFNLAKAYFDGGDEVMGIETLQKLKGEYPEAYQSGVNSGMIDADMVRLMGTSEDVPSGPARGEVLVRSLKPEKKKRIMDYLKLNELADPEDAFARWLAQGFSLTKGPVRSSSGRQVAVVDFGTNLPPDIRYDGISTEDGTAWHATSLSRRERRDLGIGGRENKSVRQEMRRENRSSNLRSSPGSEKREDKQRDRLRSREEKRSRRASAKRIDRLSQIENLHKLSKGS